MAAKKKSTPKTPFEKIGAAYESEARRQEKAGNTEMATKTRQAAAKSMTPENKKALEEDTQKAKESKMAKKKTTAKKKGASKKADAVDAAGAKAEDAVGKAKERNPIGTPASEGDKQGPPSPAGSKDNTGYGTSTQRTPKPSSKDSTPANTDDDEGTPFDGDAYAKSKEGQASRAAGMEKGKNKTPLYAAEDADARSKSRARAYAGAQPPSFVMANNDITTEMPETRREKDEARTARIKELANSGVSKDPSDKGEMPDDPKPRPKPTVMVTPTKDGEMPKTDKPGFMSRLRSRMGSFTSRPGAPAATSTPPAPSTPPSGGGSTPPPPPPSEGKRLPDPTPDLPKAVNNQNSGFQVNRGINNTGNITAAEGANVFSVSGEGNQLVGDRNTTQNITGGAGQPITATTSGKATSSGGRGITASTSGTATTKPAHPRAQNASRGGRPTSKKK